MPIRGVVFDFNGTLFWDSDKNEAAWRAFAVRHAGRSITDAEFAGLHGRPNKEFLRFLLGYAPSRKEDVDALAEEKETLYRQMCLSDPQGLCLAPGAEQLLKRLCALDIPHGIATSSDKCNVDFYFEHMGLDRWFRRECVVFNDGSIPGKPAPDFYQAAARAIGLDPAQCAVVEDAPIGIQAAHAAGIGRIVAIASEPKRAVTGNPWVYITVDGFDRAERWLDALLPATAN